MWGWRIRSTLMLISRQSHAMVLVIQLHGHGPRQDLNPAKFVQDISAHRVADVWKQCTSFEIEIQGACICCDCKQVT